MAAHTAATGLCDGDIVRYWTLLAPDDATVRHRIAVTPGVSFELARSYAGEPWGSTYRQMLRSVEIDAATYLSAQSDFQSRSAVLSNPFHARRTQDLWDTLTGLEQESVLVFNTGLDPEFIDTKYRAFHKTFDIAVNPATPTVTLEWTIGEGPGMPEWSSIVKNPNARREWVFEQLDRGGFVAADAARWPGLTRDELTEIAARTEDHQRGAAATAQLRLTAPQDRHLAEVSFVKLDVGLATWLKTQLRTGTAFQAGVRLARSGFEGSVGELVGVAETFT